MRDIVLIARTARMIRANGMICDACHMGKPTMEMAFFAGSFRLNAQAVSDLIADGWLSREGTSQTWRMDHFPVFAQ